MRRASWILASGVASFAAAVQVGCWSDYENLYLPLTKLASDGGTPPACVPSENSEPVADTCGVFVSSGLGADGNAGTKDAPLKSLADAITKANGRPIFACAEAFAGSVTLASGSAIYGGLDCTKDWS